MIISKSMKKVLGTIFAGLFIVIFTITIFSHSVGQALVQPDLYLKAVDQSGIYTLAPQVAFEYLKRGSPEYFANITPEVNEKYHQLLQVFFPQEWIRSQTEGNVRGLLGWIKGEEPELNLSLDLSGSKELIEEKGEAEAIDLVDALPPCENKQLESLGLSIGFPICLLGNYTRAELTGLIRSTGLIDKLSDQIPQTVDYTQYLFPTASQSQFQQWFERIQQAEQILKNVILLGYIVSLLLFLLVLYLVKGKLTDLAQWGGWMLILAGASAVLLSFLSRYLSLILFESLTVQTDLPESFSESAREFILSFFKELTTLGLIEGLLTMGLGLLLFLIGWRYKKASNHSNKTDILKES